MRRTKQLHRTVFPFMLNDVEYVYDNGIIYRDSQRIHDIQSVTITDFHDNVEVLTFICKLVITAYNRGIEQGKSDKIHEILNVLSLSKNAI